MTDIEEIERRFKETTGLEHIDLSVPHIEKGEGQQQWTSEEQRTELGFVTTPLWLADLMLEPQMETLTPEEATCEACSGCGQITIRMMRKLYTKFPNMDVRNWLKYHHTFTELSFANVACLIYIFGPNINVYAGDTLKIKYSKQTNEENGILFFDEKKKQWENIPYLVENLEEHKDNLNEIWEIMKKLDYHLNSLKESPSSIQLPPKQRKEEKQMKKEATKGKMPPAAKLGLQEREEKKRRGEIDLDQERRDRAARLRRLIEFHKKAVKKAEEKVEEAKRIVEVHKAHLHDTQVALERILEAKARNEFKKTMSSLTVAQMKKLQDIINSGIIGRNGEDLRDEL